MLQSKLAQLPYFLEAESTVLEALAMSAIHHHYDPNEVIFLEGDTAVGLWFIEHGRVKVFKLNADGEEHIVHIFGDGDTFNDIAAFDGGGNPANAMALSAVSVWMLPRDTLVTTFEEHTDLALTVIRVLAGRVRQLVNQIEDLTLYSVVVRLARFLIKQADDPALSGPGVTRTAIAAHINTTPQTISNALRSLEASGAIEFDRHHILIVDTHLLRSIAML